MDAELLYSLAFWIFHFGSYQSLQLWNSAHRYVIPGKFQHFATAENCQIGSPQKQEACELLLEVPQPPALLQWKGPGTRGMTATCDDHLFCTFQPILIGSISSIFIVSTEIQPPFHSSLPELAAHVYHTASVRSPLLSVRPHFHFP